MSSIVVIGSTNMDIVVKTGRFPRHGETIIGGDFFLFPGGKGANQAVAAARLGGHVRFVSKVGLDIFGDQSVEGFAKEGIPTSTILRDPQTASGVAIITVDQHGENSIVVAPGANAGLSPADLEQLRPEIEQAGIVLLQLEIPLDTVHHAIGMASAAGRKVILNPAPAATLDDELYGQLYAITPNESEAMALTGIPVTDRSSAAVAAQALLAKGVQHVVITMGSEGVLYRSAQGEWHVPTTPVEAVDTTAAGDVFNGALAVALAEGAPWPSALKWACRAAAISVTRMGAQASAPHRQEIGAIDI